MIIFEEYKLEECIDKLMDYRGKSPKKSAGIPVISAKVVKNGRILKNIEQQISHKYYSHWMCRGIPSSGDIVLTTEGPLGEVAQLDDTTSKFALGQRVITLRIRKNFNSTYIKYALMSPLLQNRLNMLSTGTTVVGISQKALLTLRIPIPERKYQNVIANVLNDLDLKIDINNRINETLEKMAQAVFQDWFVDFGPVKRKLKGINDPVAILGGLIPNPAQAQKIAGLFPDQFAENGLPRGWDLKPLTNLASIISGGTPKTSESKYWNGDIPWYSIVDAPKSGEVFVLDTQKHITIEGLNNSAARLIRPNVTIISARGTVGKLAIADHAMCFNQSCYGIEANNCINDYFIYLNLIHALNRLQNMAYGTVFSTITRKTIEKVFINIPSNDLLISFSTCVDPLFNLIKHNGEQIRTLAEMRDLLLPKLMSGEISVDELEKKMGGVL